jgi:hypothetical protein
LVAAPPDGRWHSCSCRCHCRWHSCSCRCHCMAVYSIPSHFFVLCEWSSRCSLRDVPITHLCCRAH